jgi:hypothetical protein
MVEVVEDVKADESGHDEDEDLDGDHELGVLLVQREHSEFDKVSLKAMDKNTYKFLFSLPKPSRISCPIIGWAYVAQYINFYQLQQQCVST